MSLIPFTDEIVIHPGILFTIPFNCETSRPEMGNLLILNQIEIKSDRIKICSWPTICFLLPLPIHLVSSFTYAQSLQPACAIKLQQPSQQTKGYAIIFQERKRDRRILQMMTEQGASVRQGLLPPPPFALLRCRFGLCGRAPFVSRPLY